MNKCFISIFYKGRKVIVKGSGRIKYWKIKNSKEIKFRLCKIVNIKVFKVRIYIKIK